MTAAFREGREPARAPRDEGPRSPAPTEALAHTFPGPGRGRTSAPVGARRQRAAPLLTCGVLMTDVEFLAHVDVELRAFLRLAREAKLDEIEFVTFRKRYDALRAKLKAMLANGVSNETKDQALEWLNGARTSLLDWRPHNRS